MESISVMKGSYDYGLVALSIVQAMLASYAALEMAGRVASTHGRGRAIWLTCGAASMGLGIWATHYVGMLALSMPMQVFYHLPTVVISLLTSIAASAVALFAVSRAKMGVWTGIAGSIVMGSGIAAMHYIGMAAMRCTAVIVYDVRIVALSIVLAIVTSFVALNLAFRVRGERTTTRRKIGCAVITGSAIPMMHYTGMWAASFHATEATPDLTGAIGIPAIGVFAISAITFLVLAGAVASSFFDRFNESQGFDLNTSRERELYFRTITEAVPEIIWTATPDGQDDHFNQKCFDYTGLTLKDLSGSQWKVIIHPDELEACFASWQNALRVGKPYEIEYRLRGKDGSYRWFLGRANPIRNSDGEIVKWFGICTDIENQKQNQQKLEGQIQEQSQELAETNTRLQRELYFQTMAEGIPEIVWTARPDGAIDFTNRRWLEYSGLTVEQSMDRGWALAIHPDDLAVCLAKWESALLTGDPYEAEYRMRDKNGVFRWFLVRGNPIRNSTGEIIKWFGTCADIENQKQNQQVLEEQILERTAQLADLNTRLQEEMLEKDFARNEFDQQNERMMSELKKRSERATMLAKMGELLQSCISREEVFAAAVGFAPKIFPNARGAVALLNASRNLAEVIGSWTECYLPTTEFEPTTCWALRTGHPHLVAAGETTAPCGHAVGFQGTYLCVPILAQGETLGILHFQLADEAPQLEASDLSFKTTFAAQIGLSIANIRLREALHMQSVRDALTGLYNRRYLEEVLDREFRRAGRAGQSLGILMIDLDHFKRFNDTYGHDAGDAVLRETAAFLLKNVRAEDFVCRFGGEEFVVILPTADLEGSRTRGERLRSKMRELTITHQGKPLGMVTLSVGVATFPANGMSPKELMAAADAALYQAKRGGRDQVAVAASKSTEEMAIPGAGTQESAKSAAGWS
ncbi:MAG TPA: diguanylate cyclase [Candidatus Sulfotelmatobacter sp.]|jgi:diguanylate cyclase (GGDEF)-like protein/PAS domain S-box-containing protein|nr:diguanylate cyclase [Candidatus Sulfotelmatobacter sp.]